ncbi:hypothetical protein Hanom_Chr05g00440921 [Helianthus anomalus]
MILLLGVGFHCEGIGVKVEKGEKSCQEQQPSSLRLHLHRLTSLAFSGEKMEARTPWVTVNCIGLVVVP